MSRKEQPFSCFALEFKVNLLSSLNRLYLPRIGVKSAPELFCFCFPPCVTTFFEFPGSRFTLSHFIPNWLTQPPQQGEPWNSVTSLLLERTHTGESSRSRQYSTRPRFDLKKQQQKIFKSSFSDGYVLSYPDMVVCCCNFLKVLCSFYDIFMLKVTFFFKHSLYFCF